MTTVYGAPLSPFVRKVRVCLHEKALDYQLEVVMPFAVPDGYLDISPLGRIPAFKDADGFSLADSSVICQYLEDAHPESTPLYGSNAKEAAQVRWLEKYADYELAPLTTATIFVNRLLKPTRGEACDEAAIQQALNAKLPKHFDYLEQQLGSRAYWVGEQLSLADIAIASQLINMEYAGETLDGQRWPKLVAHFARIKALSAFDKALQTELPIITQLRALVQKAL